MAFKSTSISKLEVELDWNLLSLKKGFEIELMDAIKEIIRRLDEGMNIHKKNMKEKQIVTIQDSKTEPVDLIWWNL